MALAKEEERCEISDLLPSDCAHCRGIKSELDFSGKLVAEFPALYAGKCAACDRRYEQDHRIGRTEDGDYICRRCFP